MIVFCSVMLHATVFCILHMCAKQYKVNVLGFVLYFVPCVTLTVIFIVSVIIIITFVRHAVSANELNQRCQQSLDAMAELARCE